MSLNNHSTKAALEEIQTLLPVVIEEGKPGYGAVVLLEKALDEAFDKKEIKNIALTGPFGSGKSSILKILRRKISCNNVRCRWFDVIRCKFGCCSNERRPNIKKDVLDISLAKLFDDSNNGSEVSCDSDNTDDLNRKVERSILQQLVYRERISSVSGSRIRRIKHVNRNVRCLWSFMTFVAGLSSLVLFEPAWLSVETFCNFFDFGKYNLCIDFIAACYLFCFLGYLFYRLIPSFANAKLGRLSLSDTTIELSENTSVFNKHLDEILYFFKVTKYDVVFIEDLDRYGTTDVITKLREINVLLNNSKDVGRHIVFVYALKDDLFGSSDRTKFFDYIVPVIPIVNSSNSAAVLRQYIKLSVPEEDLPEEDLLVFGDFIHDMRLLKNIVTEYSLYDRELIGNTQRLSRVKLLAMIIYKNSEPKDFALLSQHDGRVFKCFSLKSHYIDVIHKGSPNTSTINRYSKLSDILSNSIVEQDTEYENCCLSPLMKVFLHKGYIEEDYYDYISYFHEGMITKKERNLLLRMRNGVTSKYDIQIENVSTFQKMLLPHNYKNRAILNNDLLDYLLNKENDSHIDEVKLLLRNDYELASKFLPQYYESGKNYQEFCIIFTPEREDTSWQIITNCQEEKRREDLMLAWIQSCRKIPDIAKKWFVENIDFLVSHLNDMGKEDCEKLLAELKFESLANTPSDFLEMVVANRAYQLSAENINVIVSILAHKNVSDGSLKYSDCIKTKSKEFLEYLIENWSDVSEIFEDNKENEQSIMSLLEDKEYDVKKAVFRFPDFGVLEEKIYDLVISNKLIDSTWDNVLSYFSYKNLELTKELCDYLQFFQSDFDGQNIDTDNDNVKTLYIAIKESSWLSDEVRDGLLTSFIDNKQIE